MGDYITREMVKRAPTMFKVGPPSKPRPSGCSSCGLSGSCGGRCPSTSLGQEYIDVMAVVRDIHRGYKNVEPLTDFIGNHPWLSVSLAMIMILAGGAAGGFIGAGLRE